MQTKNMNTATEENFNIMDVKPVIFTDRMVLEALYARYSTNKKAWNEYRISDNEWNKVARQICSQIDAIEAVCGRQLDLFIKHC